jgi:hypothetical protein
MSRAVVGEFGFVDARAAKLGVSAPATTFD